VADIAYAVCRYRSSSMFILSVCPLVTIMYFGKTTDLIEMLLGVMGSSLPKKRRVRWGSAPPTGGAKFCGE